MKTDRGRWVELTPEETWVGTMIGVGRQRRGIYLGARHQNGFVNDPWETHIEGACAEMASYKAMGIYWCPTVSKTKEPGGDGGIYEVRRRSEDWHDLNIRQNDPRNRPYILAIGRMPRYRIVGWAWGHEVTDWNAEFEAWLMPQEQLRDLEELPF